MEDIKQKKFIENVTEVENMINDFNTHISVLADKIGGFGDKISELKKIEELNNSLSNMSDKISFLDQCNKKLNDAYNGIDDFAALEDNVKDANDKFLSIKKSLEVFDKKIQQIEKNQDGLDIDGILTKIHSVNDKFDALNNYVNDNIIKYIDVNLKNEIDNLKSEINGIKTSFDSYKNELTALTENLKMQYNDINDELKKSIEYNKQIIELFRELKNNNNDVNTFMNEIISKWYKENVSIFGIKKNKKD